MIKLFERDQTNFENNGIAAITNYIFEPVIEETLNGLFSFSFKIPIFTKYGKEIKAERIITAPIPDGTNQPFRINKVKPSMGILYVEAYHIFYDLADNFIEDIGMSGTGQSAGSKLLASTQFPNEFEFVSDISKVSNARVVRYNPVQALLDDSKDNTFISRWGGEIERNGYRIIFNSVRGTDRGVRIKNKKNLVGYEATIDYSNIWTRILPMGYDGLKLPELYVDSPNIGNYVQPKIKVIDYQNIKVNDNPENGDLITLEQAYELLRESASAEFSENHVDEPVGNYKVNFVDLSQTKEYRNFKALEKVLLGDTVYVDHTEDNFHVVSRIIKYKWNPISKRYIEIEMGSEINSASNQYGSNSSLRDDVNSAIDNSNKALSNSDEAVTSANGKNKNWYNAPDNPPTKMIVGDLWFKSIGDETELWQYVEIDGIKQWQLISSTKDVTDAKKAGEEASQKADDAQADASNALNNANSAVDKANDAAAKADQSQLAANQAKTDATTALSNANQAKTDAGKALEDSNTAITNAQNALDQYASLSFDNRNLLLNTAVPKELTGTGTENQLRTLAYFSKSTFGDYGFETGKSISFRATIEVSGSGFGGYFNFRMGPSVWASLNQTGQRYPITKAETLTFETVLPIKSTWGDNRYVDIRLDGVPTSVNLRITELQLTYSSQVIPWQRAPEDVQVTIENLGNELQAKVSQTVFDTLNQKVVTQGTAITANTKAIELKADQTVVETLSGRVTTAEGSITAMAGEVKLKANQTVVDSLTGRVSTAEGSITTLAGQVALKAEKSYVDTVKDTVGSVRSDLTVEAGKITALNTLTDGHTTQIGSLQSSYDGLSSTVSQFQTDLDGKATITDFSNLSQTVSVIQGTVANKAEQSQVTQLAGQITSLISDRKLNLLVNSDFREGTTGWSGTGMSTMPIANTTATEINKIGYPVQKFLRVTQESLAGVTAYAIQKITNPENYKGKKINFAFSYSTLGGFPNSPLQAVVRYTLDGTNYYVNFTGKSDNYLDVSTIWKRVNTTVDFTNIASTQSLSDIRITLTFVASRYTSTTQRATATAFQATEDGNMYQWGYDYCLGVDYAQTTMLQDLINLRVVKGDVVNQINLSPESILIAGNKVHITGQTTIDSAVIGTAHIKDAAITNAKISSLSADKVNAGTLDAANVNVINLNASNIVTGSISGQNLSINLATGEVNFQKGAIRSESGSFRIDIDNDEYYSEGSFGDLVMNGARTIAAIHGGLFRSGYILKNDTNPKFLNTMSYESIGRFVGKTSNQEINVMDLETNLDGTANLLPITELLISGNPGDANGVRTGSFFININQYDSTGKWINAIDMPSFKLNGSTGEAALVAGKGDLQLESYNGVIKLNGGGDGYSKGAMSLGKDTTGGRIWAMAIYERTYSSGPNVTITNAGTLGRITSARKYKMNIITANNVINNAKRVLSIQPVSWNDKSEMIHKGISKSYYGFIADEFHEKGLTEVVIYDNHGEVEGLSYDRITMYHNVILSEHEQRIALLELEIKNLKKEIEELEVA